MPGSGALLARAVPSALACSGVAPGRRRASAEKIDICSTLPSYTGGGAHGVHAPRLAIRKRERFRHDADNGHRLSIDPHDASDRRVGAAEPFLRSSNARPPIHGKARCSSFRALVARDLGAFR